MPDREDRLIMALGLGSTGHDYSGSPTSPLRQSGRIILRPLCFNCSTTRGWRSPCLNDSAICHDIVEPRGKNCMYLFATNMFSYNCSLISFTIQYCKCNHQLLIMYGVFVLPSQVNDSYVKRDSLIQQNTLQNPTVTHYY